MSNPGPASTQTTNFLFNGDSTDGIQLAGAATDKLAFHGATPVDQAAAITSLIANPPATAVATAVNAVIIVLREKGLIAT